MACTHAQVLCERFDPSILKATFTDQSQGSRHRVARSKPRGCTRRGLGSTPQAGTKASRCGCRGACIVSNIPLFRRGRPANGPTIDAGRQHGNEEFAVEPCVARQSCSRTHLPVQFHSHFAAPRIIVWDAILCNTDCGSSQSVTLPPACAASRPPRPAQRA